MTDNLLVVFIGVLTFAVLMQSVLFFLAFLNLRKLNKELLPEIKKLTKKTEATLAAITDMAESIRPVTQKLADSVEIIHNRVVEADGFLCEIVEKSRREFAVIETTLHEVTQQIRVAINTLSDCILMPVSRINALTKAVRVAAGVLFRRREKTSADTSSADSGNDTIFF